MSSSGSFSKISNCRTGSSASSNRCAVREPKGDAAEDPRLGSATVRRDAGQRAQGSRTDPQGCGAQGPRSGGRILHREAAGAAGLTQLSQIEEDFRFKFRSLLEAHLGLLSGDAASEARREPRSPVPAREPEQELAAELASLGDDVEYIGLREPSTRTDFLQDLEREAAGRETEGEPEGVKELETSVEPDVQQTLEAQPELEMQEGAEPPAESHPEGEGDVAVGAEGEVAARAEPSARARARKRTRSRWSMTASRFRRSPRSRWTLRMKPRSPVPGKKTRRCDASCSGARTSRPRRAISLMGRRIGTFSGEVPERVRSQGVPWRARPRDASGEAV